MLCLVIDLRVRLCRGRYPAFRHDALTVPAPAVQVELAELEQVAAFELQSAATLRQPQRRIRPLNVLYPERPEQVLCGKIRQLGVGGLFQYAARSGDACRAVAEAAAVRGILRLGLPRRKPFDGQVEEELDPVF